MPWSFLEQLIESASSYSDELITAKTEYQSIAGQAYEDDRSYGAQMALFHEWFVFDRILPETEITLLEKMLEDQRDDWDHRQREIFEAFRENIFGLFLVKKITATEVTVVNLFDDEKYIVSETDGPLIFNKGDLFQGRLIPFEGARYFTRSFCIHPKGACRYIESEIKSLLKEQRPDRDKWKALCREFDSLQSDVTKNRNKLEKIREKILKATNPEKQIKLEVERQEIETQGRELQKEVDALQATQTRFTIDTFKIAFRAAQCRLAHKLNYMKLKWERSRQIDLRDIYQN